MSYLLLQAHKEYYQVTFIWFSLLIGIGTGLNIHHSKFSGGAIDREENIYISAN